MHLKYIIQFRYRMAGNFRGVLIFIIFVVDLAVTKFFAMVIESMMMGMATNILAERPTLPIVSKQQ